MHKIKSNTNAKQLPLSWLFFLTPLGILFVYFVFLVFGTIAMGNPISYLNELGIKDIRAFSIFVYGIGNLLAVLIIYGLVRRRNLRASDIGFRNRLTGKGVVYAAIATIAAISLYPAVEFLLKNLNISMYWNEERSLPVTQMDSLSVFFTILGSILMAPLGEDTIFRGYLLSMLRKRFNLTLAVAISTLLFALIHLPFFGPGLAIYIIPWSIISCLLFIKFDSLYPCFAFHAANNLTAYIILPSLGI